MPTSSSQPQYSSRNPPPSNRQLLILFGILIACALVVIWLLGLLVNGLVWLIPPSVEQHLGAVVVPVFEKQAQPSSTQKTLNQLLERLESHLPSEQQARDYQVLYIPQSTINALALPGNAIIIYQGLLEAVESENELMMVLGHELGHFAHRDHLRGLGQALLLRILISSFIGDAGFLRSAAATAIQTISNAQYSQSQEKAADEFGLELLNDTYRHVAGATDFFARLANQQDKKIAFLSTHPAPRQRVEALKHLIEKRNYVKGERSPLPSVLTDLS